MIGAPAPLRAPSPSPTPAASTAAATTTTHSSPPPNQGLPVHFSPPLIAMVVVVVAAFLVVTYSRLLSRRLILLFRRYRRWSHRRRRRRYHLPSYSSTTFSSLDSPRLPFDSSFSPDAPFQLYSPYGLDDAVIKTIPLSLFTTSYKQNSAGIRDCAVCLLEFEENAYVRTLPVCSHAFHVDCIDIWLRSHANCPLCRAGIFRPDSPFVPVMASRIRPSLDDAVFINSVSLLDVHPQTNSQSAGVTNTTTATEITPYIDEPSPRRNSIQNVNDNNSYSEDNNNSNRLLKRSYSFGFERSSFLAASERMMVTEPATASPWRLRRGGFWSKRPLTPFKSRVFSFRYNRGGMIMKSPAFFRRRPSGGGGFFPLSERFSNIGGSSSSRRTKSMASPMFLRSSAAAFSSSRLRCGDPEALLSPERFNNVGR